MTKYAAGFFLILAVAAAAPAVAHAAGIEYVSVVAFTETEALLKKSTFTGDAWLRCQIATGACAEATSDTNIFPPGAANAAPAYMSAYRSLLPSGATRVIASSDIRYISFYIPGFQSRGKRTIGVLDTTNLQTYTKDEKLEYWDLMSESTRIFAFSPDSSKLIYLSDVKNHPTPYLVDLASLSNGTLVSEKMLSKEYTVGEITWKDNNTILFIANRDNTYAWALYELNLDTYALKKVSDNASYDSFIQKSGSVFLFGINDSRGVRPGIYDTATGKVREFSFPSSSPEETKGKAVTTLKNGLSGVFLLEPSGKSNTLLVWLHGGPYRQTSLGYHPYKSYGGYDWMLEKVRDADVGVLKLDYPGSFGKGRLFSEALIGQVGVKDVKDTYAAISDFAKRNGYTNVYLMGNSYGGYLALRVLVDKPTAYKGAFSIGGVMDWTTMLTALDTSIFNALFKGVVSEENDNYDLYNNASIYNRVDKLSGQKIVLMHGEKDMTIGKKQSEGLATYLASINKPAELVIMPGEDHVFKSPASFVLLCEKALAFVGKPGKASCNI
jgi:dipeptidyl aminopeptidase/acylaminoacyl peptidase